MGFGSAISKCLSSYATFSGRASRAEYWWFFLFLTLAGAVASLIDWQFFTTTATVAGAGGTQVTTSVSYRPVHSIVTLALFLPHLAVAFRRMHDTGRSGLYVFLPFLMMLTALAVIVFGIGLADLFASGGSLDILFTRLTGLTMIPILLILVASPLLVLWWLTRPSQPGPNAYGPNPYEVTT